MAQTSEPKIHGIIAYPVTPFSEKGIDVERLAARLALRQIRPRDTDGIESEGFRPLDQRRLEVSPVHGKAEPPGPAATAPRARGRSDRRRRSECRRADTNNRRSSATVG